MNLKINFKRKTGKSPEGTLGGIPGENIEDLNSGLNNEDFFGRKSIPGRILRRLN